MYFTVPSCKRRLALAAVLLSALVLAGCAVAPNTGSGSRSGHSGSSSTQTRDPLLDAPHHSETTCTTDRPVTVRSVKCVMQVGEWSHSALGLTLRAKSTWGSL